ncbi:MAG: hypothetical protein ACKKMV_00485 [Candidatus Nealsonbacteria bacterium]|nr:MAG: hypothetical protein IB617_01405 [Candidatus Nealsonbacteria bacterium]
MKDKSCQIGVKKNILKTFLKLERGNLKKKKKGRRNGKERIENNISIKKN